MSSPFTLWKRWTKDNLDESDVRHAVLNGDISAELTDDPRGSRFVVRGTTSDNDREMDVVCRLLPSGLLRIIAVYQLEE